MQLKYCQIYWLAILINKNQILYLSQLKNETNRVPNGAGHLYSLSDRIVDNQTLINNKIDCVGNIGYTYLDSEILGFSDMLILPIGSNFTRLSRLLMIQRQKRLCVAWRGSLSFAKWYCDDFKKKIKHGKFDLLKKEIH